MIRLFFYQKIHLGGNYLILVFSYGNLVREQNLRSRGPVFETRVVLDVDEIGIWWNKLRATKGRVKTAAR